MKPPSPIIDILSAESFASEHLPGAVNFCVYETAFTEKMLQAFPDKAAPLTIYGLSDRTQEAGVALARLSAAGYTNVTALAGGLEGWKANGGNIERAPLRSTPSTRRLSIDTKESLVRWTGRNLFNFHSGTLKLGCGHVDIAEGRLTGAVMTIDMTSLHCSNLTDSAMNSMLIDHLRSADFFDVEAHPQATFTLDSARVIAGATDGAANYRIQGSLSLRGRSHEIEFPALIAEKSPDVWVAQATPDFDRTLWGANYGSGKLFARLGPHVVNDVVHLHLKIVTAPDTAE